ncbi:MAG: GNAT family N-acetyltransferase [Planctomycetales bacterium]|nr:GNAT family N-acetyltransferase [Planctomycetales bacterium]
MPLETERLILRDWQPEDLEAFHAICTDPSVMQFVGDGEPWARERTEQFVGRACEMSQAVGFCQWPVIYKPSSTVIGFCGFVPANDGGEIGWRLAQEYWGRGLATEAARAVLELGFETLGFQRIIATVQSPNRASIRVVEKLGLKPESRFHRNGRELIVFSITNQRADAG